MQCFIMRFACKIQSVICVVDNFLISSSSVLNQSLVICCRSSILLRFCKYLIFSIRFCFGADWEVRDEEYAFHVLMWGIVICRQRCFFHFFISK